jgi:hypothetical protein
MKKTILGAAFVALTLGSLTTGAFAAPASGAPIANAAGSLDAVQQVWVDRWGRWHPNRRAIIVRPPVIGPACRSVRICDWRGCYWTRRCY